ncbi:hypothetical protein DID77_01830 [Candidatus Marinamargulisbacteria bacterium SCGC AG-439-L15]|nr:hypothetical protein DID77_01830 [Candidatus Marinamargulisbacteria bacterium SCGC AG-439-L15]
MPNLITNFGVPSHSACDRRATRNANKTAVATKESNSQALNTARDLLAELKSPNLKEGSPHALVSSASLLEARPSSKNANRPLLKSTALDLAVETAFKVLLAASTVRTTDLDAGESNEPIKTGVYNIRGDESPDVITFTRVSAQGMTPTEEEPLSSPVDERLLTQRLAGLSNECYAL